MLPAAGRYDAAEDPNIPKQIRRMMQLYEYGDSSFAGRCRNFSWPEARDLLAPVIHLDPLTPEEMLVLCEKLAEMYANLYGYERQVGTDDLVGFIKLEYARVGADQNITPRVRSSGTSSSC